MLRRILGRRVAPPSLHATCCCDCRCGTRVAAGTPMCSTCAVGMCGSDDD